MKTKILIVDEIHEVLLEKLLAANISFEYRPDFDRTDTEKIIGQFGGLVIRSKFQVDRHFLEKATDLAFVARAGAGMDNVDDVYAKARGIQLINAPEGNRQAVAEHMTGMLLSLLNKLRTAHDEIRGRFWKREENRGTELQGKTVALIGYGNNGQAMAKCLSGFGVQVIAYDKYKTGFSDAYAREVSMEEVVKFADIVSLHIPLTRETRNMVDREYLFHFKKPIVFLNGARGEIVDVQAVLYYLDSGKITATAMDVLPGEKFPELGEQPWFETLSTHPRVLLSPHVAGWTVESYRKISDVLADKIISYIRTKIG